MPNNPEPPADGRPPDRYRFTPEQIEEGRRHGPNLGFENTIDLSDVVKSILAELRTGDGPAARPGGRP